MDLPSSVSLVVDKQGTPLLLYTGLQACMIVLHGMRDATSVCQQWWLCWVFCLQIEPAWISGRKFRPVHSTVY